MYLLEEAMCQKFQKQLFTVGGGSKRFEGTFSPKRQGERVSTPLHAMVCLKITDFIYDNRVTIAFLEVPF